MRHEYPAWNRRRAGVSLLEVVFSIGIVLIGLVGIAALLPLAGVQASKGLTADRAAQLGQRAVQDFHVRGMTQPRSWRWFNPAASNFVPFSPAIGQSFCIDPLLIGAGTTADFAVRNKFPFNIAYDTASPPDQILWMPRCTLAPSLTAAVNAWMSVLQAKQIFVSHDDLVFDLPEDRTLGPVQNFGMTSDKRQIEAHYSWLATVVPKLNRNGSLTDEYTLSIVVFLKRILDSDLTREDVVNERVASVTAFYSGAPALGGGAVQLSTRPGRIADDLEVRQGQWVMLSAEKLLNTTPPRTVQIHRWYRVVTVDEAPLFDATNNVWLRDVTLVGPDWDYTHTRYSLPYRPLGTQVTIPRSVVAVFEKTIRIETSSLWTL